MKQYILYTFFLIWGISGVKAQKFVAFANKNKVSNGEVFQVSFRLENAKASTIKYPSFEGFDVRGGPNTSQSMQIVSGQVSQSVTYSFYLRPKKLGKIKVGPASTTINGETLTTNSVTIEVVAGNSSGGQASPGGTSGVAQNPNQGKPSADLMKQIKESVFIRVIPSKTSVYQGEQFSVTYKLYTRYPLADLSLSSSPAYKDFWVENLDVGQTQYKQEVYNGVNHNTAVIKKVILFPQRPGKLAVDPIELEAQVRVKVQSQKRRRSIFDDFFDDPFFGSFRDVPFTFSSRTLNITVKPLPTNGKPTSFSGIVGKYALDVSLDQNETETGEPVTMKVLYQGTGNIKTLPEPQLDFPPDFEVWDAKVSDNTSTRNGFVSGKKSFDYLIIPRNPGEYKLPVIDFVSFDPERGSYVTRSSKPYTLKVTGEPQQVSQNIAGMGKEDIELIGEDIRFIQTIPGTWEKRGDSFWGSGIFWSLIAAPFLLFALLLYGKQRQEQLASDVAGTRSRKATKVAKKRLSKAKGFLNNKDERAFYNEISQVIWGYLGDKFNLETADMSREVIQEKLQEQAVSEELISQAKDVLDTSEMALFAPSSNGTHMADAYQAAEKLITDLEKSMNP
ncbi:MAG: BatD family protein [Bacteroidota bacterium]